VLNSAIVKPEAHFRAPARMARSLLAGLMALLLVVTSLLAVSPAHTESHLLHHGGASQDCALCLFSHGQVDFTDPVAALVIHAPVSTDCFVPHTVSFVSAPDYQFLPERAPPAFS